MIPKIVTFMLTYKCNIACDHCSVCSGPWRQETLHEDVIRRIIDDIYDIASIEVCVFTGGEPTLYADTLKRALSYAYYNGFITRVVTNAWWAKNYNKSLKFLDDLRSAGLKELNTSYDDFHAKYISINNVINAIKAALDLNLRIVIGIIRSRSSKINAQYLMKIFRDEGIDCSKIIFEEDYVQPVGRAVYTLPEEEYVERKDVLNSGCVDILRVITVHPDGRITACCGHTTANPYVKELVIGYINSGSIKELIKRAQKCLLYWLIFAKGSMKIMREILNVTPSEKIFHSCQACYVLFTKYRLHLYKVLTEKRHKILEMLLM